MHVVLDATAIPANRAGVGRYLECLIPGLAASDIDLTLVAQPRDEESLGALAPSARVVVAPSAISRRPVRLAWEQTGLPRLVRSLGADVLHSPHYTMPSSLTPSSLTRGRAEVPVVVTLHDATFFSLPAVHTAVKGPFFRAAIRHAVRHAAGLIVPSYATRDEVLRYVGGDPSRFTVAYHGVDRSIFHEVGPEERARVAASLGLEGTAYVAFLGTLEPRKNVPALIEAWVRVAGGMDQPPALVLAGGTGWDHDVDAAIRAVPSHLTLVRPGFLPFEDLAGYLAGAEVVAYPALGEGFGLPVLEAMSCGAPVLTSGELSIPEVGGRAVEYCGTRASHIAAGLSHLFADAGRRAELRRAGPPRAAGFTWERATERHLEAYRRAAA